MKVLALGLLLGAMCMSGSAIAGDGWEARPSVCANIPAGPRSDRCHYWVDRVRVPGTEGRCCGPADAYIADDWEMVDGELYMTITTDYPETSTYTYDEEGNPIQGIPNAFQAKKGMRIHVPRDKIVTRVEDANQSPHSVIFMRSSDGWVYCAILGALI